MKFIEISSDTYVNMDMIESISIAIEGDELFVILLKDSISGDVWEHSRASSLKSAKAQLAKFVKEIND